jgi:hypothetical protein
MGNKISSENINPEYLKAIKHIITLQKAYKKLKSKREKMRLLQETIQIRLKDFDNKENFEFLSRKSLRENFGKNNIYEIILRNSTLSSFNKESDIYQDYISALSILGTKHILIKPELPVKLKHSNIVYDGQWNLDMKFCGFGIIYNNFTNLRTTISINSNLFALKNEILFKAISGVFENNRILDNLKYRIFFNNGLTYEGYIHHDKNQSHDNIICSYGEGTLYINNDVIANHSKINKLVKIKAVFSNDLEFQLNSEVIYYFEDFTIRLTVTSDFNSLNVFEGEIYLTKGVFKGKFIFDNSQNSYSFIKGIFKYKNGNIYQGEFFNS